MEAPHGEAGWGVTRLANRVASLKAMIRIRHSTVPCEELELEGSNSELAELRATIVGFCESGEPVLVLIADLEFDPYPYQHRLGGLSLRKTTESILISVTGGTLSISGRSELLRLFADNLPYEANPTSSAPPSMSILIALGGRTICQKHP